MPIYFLLNYQNVDKIEKLIKKFKDTKIIFGYGGFPMFNKVWKLINKYENCYIDLASNHIDSSIIMKIYKNINYKRILFASDCPYNFKDTNGNFNYNKLFERMNYISKNKLNYILQNRI